MSNSYFTCWWQEPLIIFEYIRYNKEFSYTIYLRNYEFAKKILWIQPQIIIKASWPPQCSNKRSSFLKSVSNFVTNFIFFYHNKTYFIILSNYLEIVEDSENYVKLLSARRHSCQNVRVFFLLFLVRRSDFL